MTDTIDSKGLKERLDSGDDLLLVDVLPPGSFLRHHIPGAVNIPLDYLHEVVEILPHDRDIVVYCTNEECEFSEIAARKLGLHGFTRVYKYTGGLQDWYDQGYELQAHI